MRVGSNIIATPALPGGGSLGVGKTNIAILQSTDGSQFSAKIYPTVFSVSNATWSSNTATLTTTVPHGILIGQPIKVLIPYSYLANKFSWYANTATVTTKTEHYILQ